jgi:hypothetical protein
MRKQIVDGIMWNAQEEKQRGRVRSNEAGVKSGERMRQVERMRL